MLLFSVLPPLSSWIWAILDATLLIILLSPVLYFFVLRPMMLNISERIQAEDETALAYSELNQIFNTAADGMRLIDKDFTVLRTNETFSALSGVSRDDAIGKKCYEVFSGPVCSTPDCPLTRILGGEKRVEYEVEKKRVDGMKIPCFVTGTPFRGPKGELVGIVEDFKDITIHKQAEEAVRESEEKFRSISTSAQDGIIMIDDEGNISYWNEAAERIFGYTRKEALGKEAHLLLMPKERHDAYRKEFSTFRETGKGTVIGKTLELSAMRKDGAEFPVELSVSSVKVKGTWHAIGIARDVTERKKSEEALRQSEGKLNAMLYSIGDHMSMMDRELNILWANEIAKNIFGDNIIGKKCYDVYHRREQPCEPHPCLTLRAFLDGKIHEHETSVIDKDGKTIHFHCTANVALRDEHGNPTAVIEISRDITEQKHSEEQLKSYQDQLRSTISQLSLVEEQERRRIATDLHDHIGQTLAYCKIKIGEMLNSPPLTDMKGYLNEIRTMIDKTINYCRSLTFDLSNPMLYEVGFEAALEWLGEKFQKEYGLIVHFKNDRQQKPLDDKTRVILLQVMRELLTNILKHARAHNVTVSVKRKNAVIHIDVKDDGIGFDITQTSTHLNNTYSFGIFSIRERLQSINGKLTIESAPGYGTSVTLTAPLHIAKENVMEITDEH